MKPEGFSQPSLLMLNRALAADLGLDLAWLEANGAAVFSGSEVVDGAKPLAQAYAGHQFGQFNPGLGDGRALLVGEVVDPAGQRFDLHLKGSGTTPFSRRGDGRAALDSVGREYIVSEAMAALGVPTTRALAIVTTGETVMRERSAPGAVLTRVASSHLRVGTLELFAAQQEHQKLAKLVQYALRRHYPERVDTDNPAQALLDAVAEAQGQLVAHWMSIGFVHGVMNTDNVTLSGETIDYGPCAFMEAYDPETVFSQIDQMGRYAYGNQPGIGAWNLARMAEALIEMLGPNTEAAVEQAQASLELSRQSFAQSWIAHMRGKLGLTDAQ
ncbi:MAG: YdiU family protein, partial [Myxococcota bacterium]